MLTYLSKHDDEVVEQARAANAKLPKMASGRDTTVHLFTGSNGANRPKHSVGVGRMGSARPAVPAYQRITPPPMDAALAGTTSPMYFETLGPLLERYQVREMIELCPLFPFGAAAVGGAPLRACADLRLTLVALVPPPHPHPAPRP